jgi:hypothetical protein
MRTHVFTVIVLAVLPLAQGQDSVTLHNAVRSDGGYTLAPGPNADGVVFLRQIPEEGHRE